MESLRLLLMVLMNQFDGPLLNQEVSTEYINQMTMLVGEVQNQRVRIEELTQLMQQQPMTGSPGRNLGHPTFRVPDSEEEWEPVSPQQRVPEMVTTRKSNISEPIDSPTCKDGSSYAEHSTKDPKACINYTNGTGSNVPSWKSWSPIKPDRDSNVLANTSLESWGNKRVSWERNISKPSTAMSTRGTISTCNGWKPVLAHTHLQ